MATKHNMENQINEIKAPLEVELNTRLENISIPKQGTESFTFFAKVDEQDAVIKIAKKRNSYPLETWAYNEMQRLGIPVPLVIKYIPNLEPLNKPCIVITKIKGTSLKDANITIEQKLDLFYEAGKVLKTIHEIKTEGIGYFDLSSQPPRGMYEDLATFYSNEYDFEGQFEFLQMQGVIPLEEREQLNQNYQNLLKTNLTNPVLVYNDFQKDHIFTDGKKISGIIDPGNAFSGSKYYDVALAIYFQSEEETERFLEGYGERGEEIYMNLALVASYKLVASIKGSNSNTRDRIEILKKVIRNLPKSSY